MEPSHTFSFNEVTILYSPLSFPTSTEEYETLNKSCIRAINNESIYVARSLYTESRRTFGIPAIRNYIIPIRDHEISPTRCSGKEQMYTWRRKFSFTERAADRCRTFLVKEDGLGGWFRKNGVDRSTRS